MNKVHGHTIAREHVIKLLYSRNFINDQALNLCHDKLALKMYQEIVNHEAEINALIKKYLIKWDIKHLNPVDLAILQLSVYELKYSDLNQNIIVSEALNLCKKYSTNDSKRFIHKICDLVSKELDGA